MDYAKFHEKLNSLPPLEAIAYLDAHFEDSALSPALCVRKADFIQLAIYDDLGDYDFPDVERLLLRAIEVAPRYYYAHYELGIFYMLHLADYKSSRKHLALAKETLLENMQELEDEFSDLDLFEEG